MKTTLFLVICFVSTVCLAQETEINSTLDKWHKAAENADYETYFGLMTEDAVFVGSDASEVWSADEFKTFSKPYFDDGKAWTFTPVNRNVYVNNTMAWFDEILNSRHMGLCRGSGVLLKDANGQWKIQHYVLSLAIPNPLVSQFKLQKAKLDKDYLNQQD